MSTTVERHYWNHPIYRITA